MNPNSHNRNRIALRIKNGRIGGGNVAAMMKVVINNYSSENVTATEKEGVGGEKQLEITIGSMINKHISSGKADKSLGSRYGLKAKGV